MHWLCVFALTFIHSAHLGYFSYQWDFVAMSLQHTTASAAPAQKL
jgi:hypothetical protein